MLHSVAHGNEDLTSRMNVALGALELPTEHDCFILSYLLYHAGQRNFQPFFVESKILRTFVATCNRVQLICTTKQSILKYRK